MGIFRWNIEKEGCETVQAAAFTYKRDESRKYFNIPDNLKWVLARKGSLPPGMVRAAGGKVQDVGQIDDFFIDRFEVTNRQFKEFVDQGGYQKKEYWKNPFVKNGQTLTWERAIAEFVDQTGRPGPSTWRAGAFPQGHEDHPVSGVSWYEAAAFAEFAGKSLPTSYHWDVARGELTPLYQSGFLSIFYPLCNFQREGRPKSGEYPGPDGLRSVRHGRQRPGVVLERDAPRPAGAGRGLERYQLHVRGLRARRRRSTAPRQTASGASDIPTANGPGRCPRAHPLYKYTWVGNVAFSRSPTPSSKSIGTSSPMIRKT